MYWEEMHEYVIEDQVGETRMQTHTDCFTNKDADTERLIDSGQRAGERHGGAFVCWR